MTDKTSNPPPKAHSGSTDEPEKPVLRVRVAAAVSSLGQWAVVGNSQTDHHEARRAAVEDIDPTLGETVQVGLVTVALALDKSVSSGPSGGKAKLRRALEDEHRLRLAAEAREGHLRRLIDDDVTHMWMGDGEDDLDSLCNDVTVRISAAHLRGLLAFLPTSHGVESADPDSVDGLEAPAGWSPHPQFFCGLSRELEEFRGEPIREEVFPAWAGLGVPGDIRARRLVPGMEWVSIDAPIEAARWVLKQLPEPKSEEDEGVVG